MDRDHLDADQAWLSARRQWGQALHPNKDPAAEQKLLALSHENAALRDELQGIKLRLAAVETIVTDDGVRLTKAIHELR